MQINKDDILQKLVGKTISEESIGDSIYQIIDSNSDLKDYVQNSHNSPLFSDIIYGYSVHVIVYNGMPKYIIKRME